VPCGAALQQQQQQQQQQVVAGDQNPYALLSGNPTAEQLDVAIERQMQQNSMFGGSLGSA
jgi:hypothetical protein